MRVEPVFCSCRGVGGFCVFWTRPMRSCMSPAPFLRLSGVLSVRAAGGIPRDGTQPRGMVSSGGGEYTIVERVALLDGRGQ